MARGVLRWTGRALWLACIASAAGAVAAPGDAPVIGRNPTEWLERVAARPAIAPVEESVDPGTAAAQEAGAPSVTAEPSVAQAQPAGANAPAGEFAAEAAVTPSSRDFANTSFVAPEPGAAVRSSLPADTLEAHRPLAPFRGEEYRFQNRSFLRRLASDYAAIPLGIPHWSAGEWTWFATTVGVTVGLFLPLDRPLDQRFQNWLAAEFPNAVPHLWSPFNDIFIFGGLFLASAGTLTYGLVTDQSPYVETFSLMLEALVLTQTLHIGTKLLLSRDGPNTGSGHFINGPTFATFERFPEGAPSGHTATLFALATVVSSYWDNAWLSAGLYTVATVFASALVLDRYHYISDVLWGGSMGVAVGRYVVHHRSSRFTYVNGKPRRISELNLTPFVAPTTGGAAGGAVLQGEF